MAALMDPGAALFLLLLAVFLRIPRERLRIDAELRRRPRLERQQGVREARTSASRPRQIPASRPSSVTSGAVVAMLVLETCVVVHALYPPLSPLAGSHLSPDHACHQDTQLLRRALRNRTLWAERLLDASSRGVSGGFSGARFHLGHFDACVSAGAVSPVGSRYCLASLSMPMPAVCLAAPSAPSARPWDFAPDVDGEADAADVLRGCGLAPGALSPADVHVALCVPDSCDAAALEQALRNASAVRRSGFHVAVRGEHCTRHAEVLDGAEHGVDVPARLFWTLCFVLTCAFIAAPYRGWPSWNWRTHIEALSKPDAPVQQGVDLSALSGMRTLTTVLIVSAHRGLHGPRLPHSNTSFVSEASRTGYLEALGFHASLLVDSFFFMSGLLLSLSADTRDGNRVRAFVNRYLRLTPTYAFVILFYATAMESLGSGPLWKAIVGAESEACRRWGWSNLLYVNNYVSGEPGEVLCMLNTWSMAVEMHMLVVGLLILPWLRGLVSRAEDGVVNKGGVVVSAVEDDRVQVGDAERSAVNRVGVNGGDAIGGIIEDGVVSGDVKDDVVEISAVGEVVGVNGGVFADAADVRLALALVGVVAVFAVPPFALTLLRGWPPVMIWTGGKMRNLYASPEFMDMYRPTHMRAAPHVVGFLAGLLILRLKDRGVELGLSATRWLTYGSLAVLVALLVSSAPLSALSPPALPPLADALYASLTPVMWAATLAVMVATFVLGQHTAARGLLQWQPLVSLSRLTYGVYLLHFSVQLMQGAAERNPVHITPATVSRGAAYDLFYCFLLSLWMHLALEAPVRHITKSFLARKSSTTDTETALTNRQAGDVRKPEALPEINGNVIFTSLHESKKTL